MAELVEAAEAVEEVAAEVARVTDPRVVAAGILIGFGAGFGVGWYIANRRLAVKYEKIAQDEIDQMREHFRARDRARAQQAQKIEPVEKIVKDAGYRSPTTAPHPHVPEGDPLTKNVFEEAEDITDLPEEAQRILATKDPNDDWDYELELANRPDEGIYVIHEDEQHEKEYLTATLTYFEGDGILSDIDDHIIEDQAKTIGEDNLKWGHGSRDPNTVFIRNDILACDFEVCRSTDTYAHVVHGLQHSDETFQRVRRRAARDDE